MTKIVILGDSHFGVKNDSDVMLDHFEKFYSNVLFPYMKKNNIKTLIQTGDLFDRRKYVNFKTLDRFEKMFLQPLIQNNIETHIYAGNHCVFYKTTNKVNSLDGLLGYTPDNIKIYTEPVADQRIGDTDFCILPWINQENYEESLKAITESNSIYCLGHLELSGFEMYRGMVNEHGMDKTVFEKFQMTISGHFHHRSTSHGIHYVGTPYEMTWQDYDDPKGFHILDTKKRELTFIENPYKLYHKLFYADDVDLKTFDASKYENCYLKVIVKKKENPLMFERMVDKIYLANVADFSVLEDLPGLNEDSNSEGHAQEKSTIEVLADYVDSLQTDKNKNKIKSMMQEIYLEALNGDY